MTPIIKYLLITSIRDRFYIGIFITLLVSFAISIFLGSTSLNEQQQMATTYIAGSSRAIMVIGMILFVCLSVARAFENREVEFMISKPISREKFVLGYLAGFILVAGLILLPLAIAMYFSTRADLLGFTIWVLSLLSELIIVISFALVTSLILRNALSAILASFGFYILARMIGVFLYAVNMPQDFAAVKSHIFTSILKFLSVIFPRIDLFGQSSWLIYGVSDFYNLKVILLQSIIYIPLLIIMALHDFRKKQF